MLSMGARCDELKHLFDERLLYLHAVVAVRIAKQLLKAGPVQHLFNQELASARLADTNALEVRSTNIRIIDQCRNHLLDHIRAELLDGKSADVARELPDHTIAKAVVVEIEDVLHHLSAMSKDRIRAMKHSRSSRTDLARA
jgi:hypothetical protein